MDIRPASENDIPAIVELLKLSLGEELLPKSESYWRWKHVGNPFGRSPVLLAFEKDQLVGVRAFMHWKWQNGKQVYSAVRAVDTATHPDHQGKGIFKKLTLMLLDQCKADGVDFVFNTPNQNSKPGYLKMGWQEAGKLPVSLKCNRPFGMAIRAAGIRKGEEEPLSSDAPGLADALDHAALAALLQNDHDSHATITTQHTPASLRWRYQLVKVVEYHHVRLEQNGKLRALAIYRIKPGKLGNELRVTDIFMESANFKKEVATLIAERVNLHKPEYMTVSASNHWVLRGLLLLKGMNIGPIVTIKNIENGPMDVLQHFRGWSPSLGDLELF